MDFTTINNLENQSKIAIVCIGYNRLDSIQRLIKSLENAVYPNSDVPLVLSIDASGYEDLYTYVCSLNWTHGEKYVNIEKERLGLRKHIFQCAGLSKFFRAVVLLEDDTFVSPFFYNYALESVEQYQDDNNVAEIALYRNSSNGYAQLPFESLDDGSDTFLMQDVCTSGECFTYRMWSAFEKWMESHGDEDVQNTDMQPAIKGWTRAWSKYYNAYVVSNNMHVVYPRTSLTTNFNDFGEHGADLMDMTQVPLSFKNNTYRMLPSEQMIKYDIFANNESLYEWIGLSRDELCLDVYGTNPNLLNKRYVFSSKLLPYKQIRSYGLKMHPVELNVKYNISGNGLYLYDTTIKDEDGIKQRSSNLLNRYFLHDFSMYRLKVVVMEYFKGRLKEKLHVR